MYNIYRMSKKRTDEISRKLSIFEKNVSYKNCRVLNDLFTDLISLTLGDQGQVKITLIFLNDTSYF